jgi:hypothetical protein
VSDLELHLAEAKQLTSAANFLVNQRMNKAQQMRWSRRGADLLLQVRCAVYNGAFGSGFGKPFEPTSNTVQQSPWPHDPPTFWALPRQTSAGIIPTLADLASGARALKNI